jgi:hypothetical protein
MHLQSSPKQVVPEPSIKFVALLGSIMWPDRQQRAMLFIGLCRPMSVAQLAIYSHDEDMTPSDATIQYKVWPFLCLYDDINKNLMLPNVVTSISLETMMMMM